MPIPPETTAMTAAFIERVKGLGTTLSVGDGDELFSPGDEGKVFLLPLAGSIRVEHSSPNGRQVVLYRLAPGDSCVLTTSCLLSGHPYAASGYAEGDVEALAISAANFQKLLAEDSEFRTFVLSAFSSRMIELTSVIDDFLLNRTDLKVARWLLAQSKTSKTLMTTHSKIATELGSVREVVSRILKEFERKSWVVSARGSVSITDESALRKFTKTDM